MAVVVDSSASLRREHVLLSELQEASKANLKGIFVVLMVYIHIIVVMNFPTHS